MNIENLKLLRDAIAESETYDQSRWAHPCGTPACVAGHAAVLAGGTLVWGRLGRFAQITPNTALCEIDGVRRPVENVATDWLELNGLQAAGMFQGNPYDEFPPNHRVPGYGPVPSHPTKRHALAMLDDAIEHQQVNWFAGVPKQIEGPIF